MSSTKSETERTFESTDVEYIPVVRSGGWADIGSRSSMEDVYICCDNFLQDFGPENCEEGPSSFYGVCFYSNMCVKFSLLFLETGKNYFKQTDHTATRRASVIENFCLDVCNNCQQILVIS